MDTVTEANQISRQIYTNYFHEYPLQDTGNDLSSSWSELLQERAGKIVGANWEIARSLKEKFGENSNEAVASEIFARLTPSITKIAIDQYKVTDLTKNYSWKDISPENVVAMKKEIALITSDPKNAEFLQKNSSFLAGLNLLDELADKSDEDELLDLSLQYEQICKDAINNGEPIIFTSYFVNGYYLAPENSDSPDTPMYEITLDLIFPPSKNLLILSRQHNDLAIKNMEKLKGRSVYEKYPDNITGWTIASAGFTILSQTGGMALDSGGIFTSFDSSKGNHKIAWQRALQIVGEDPDIDYLPYLMALYFHHEHGHNFFPGKSGFDEIQTDIPTMVSLFTLMPDIDKTKMLCFALSEFITEVKSEKTDNEVINGYMYSAIFNVNKLIEYGIIVLSENSGFTFDFSDQKIEEFSQDIMSVHKKLLEKNEETGKQILDITPSEGALKLAEILA